MVLTNEFASTTEAIHIGMTRSESAEREVNQQMLDIKIEQK
jgi:hypothetical protein